MSKENDSLLELIGKGDTLQALHRLHGDGDGNPVLELNRALYGVGDAQDDERLGAADQELHDALGSTQGADRAALLFALGCIALRQDDVMEASMRFGEVLELEPGHQMARHNLAYAHELLAETADARREYEEVLASYPGAALTRLNLAQLSLQEGDYDTGLGHLDALCAEQPGNLGLLLYLCRALLERAEPSDLERVVNLVGRAAGAQDFVELQECRAYALARLERFAEAEAAFRALLEQDPDSTFALGGLLRVLGQLSRFNELAPLAARLHELAPGETSTQLLQELEGI